MPCSITPGGICFIRPTNNHDSTPHHRANARYRCHRLGRHQR
ncbi:hypothetical protein ACUHMQ_00805 [Chitinimonas sp. PSY-7]